MQLSTHQIDELRAAYSKIDRVDPYGTAFAGMRKLLDALSQDDLKMLANAGIKFISKLALNRIAPSDSPTLHEALAAIGVHSEKSRQQDYGRRDLFAGDALIGAYDAPNAWAFVHQARAAG